MKPALVILPGLCCLLPVAFLAGCATKKTPDVKPAAVVPAAATPSTALKVEKLGAPVVTSRLFTGGVAPNSRGGWSFIGQFMNYRSTGNKEKETRPLPTGQHYLIYKNLAERPEAEWLVGDLQTGKYKLIRLPGFHSGITPCLAGNGRLFFSVDYAHLYYYEPAEGTVKILGRVCDDIVQLRNFYKLLLGPDGLVYGSAQTTSGVTVLIRLNPDTLEYELFDKVGLRGRRENLTYGYYLAVDPPWMYVAVGQGNWELFAVNADTGEKRCLAEATGDGSRIVVSQGEDFCSAEILRPGSAKETPWLIDGKLVPKGADGKKPDATPIRQKQFRGVQWKQTRPRDVARPPEVDNELTGAMDEKGRGAIHWRPAGATGEWQRVAYAIQNAEPVRIESLLALPDGSLLGNASQYNGFFRYHPASGKLDTFGKHGPSGAQLALCDGKVFISGYPNTLLLTYDPALPWTSTNKTDGKGPGDNPRHLGTMGQGCTESHHARALVNGGNGRIYLMGHRERWSTGTGLGYYEPATGKFFGLGTANKEMEPSALVVLPQAGRVVLSGHPRAGGDARLIVYDLDLKELERLEIRPGLAGGGALFRSESDTAFLGCVENPATKQFLFYRYDYAAKKIVKLVELPAAVEAVLPRAAGGTWWALVGDELQTLNPATLKLKAAGRIEGRINFPAWVGKKLYGTQGGELVRVAVP